MPASDAARRPRVAGPTPRHVQTHAICHADLAEAAGMNSGEKQSGASAVLQSGDKTAITCAAHIGRSSGSGSFGTVSCLPLVGGIASGAECVSLCPCRCGRERPWIGGGHVLRLDRLLGLVLSGLTDVPELRAGKARRDRGRFVAIAFVPPLCGATSCAEMARVGRAKESFPRGFLKLKPAIPSHDTFLTVLQMIDPKALGGLWQAARRW